MQMLSWFWNRLKPAPAAFSRAGGGSDEAEHSLLPAVENGRVEAAAGASPNADEGSPDDFCSRSLQLLQESELRAQARRRQKRIFIGTLGCILLLMGLATFVLYPRGATFKIESFDINAENTTFYEGDQLMTNWISDVKIANHNFFPLNIHEMRLSLFLKKDRSAPIGKGRGSLLYVSSRSVGTESIEFQMPVYAPSSSKPSLISECMLNDRVDLLVMAQIDLSWTHWSGRWLPLSFIITVDCRIPALKEAITLAHLD